MPLQQEQVLMILPMRGTALSILLAVLATVPRANADPLPEINSKFLDRAITGCTEWVEHSDMGYFDENWKLSKSYLRARNSAERSQISVNNEVLFFSPKSRFLTSLSTLGRSDDFLTLEPLGQIRRCHLITNLTLVTTLNLFSKGKLGIQTSKIVVVDIIGPR